MDTHDNTLDEEVQRVLNALSMEIPGTEEYLALVKLYRSLHDAAKSERISRDAILLAATNILGILIVLNFERVGVITSKAFGFIRRT